MMDAKHSPLPWKMEMETHFDSDEQYFRSVVGPDGKTICLAGFAISMGSSDDETFANSAFIVKAVNSYAKLVNALKESRAQIEYLHDKFQETGSGNAILARIDAALAPSGE